MIKLIIMLFIICVVVWWVNSRIDAGNPSFYAGKDEGMSARFESILILSTLFYCIMAEKNRIILLVVGFFAGLACSVISISLVSFFDGLRFQIIACILFVLVFALINRLWPSFTNKNR